MGLLFQAGCKSQKSGNDTSIARMFGMIKANRHRTRALRRCGPSVSLARPLLRVSKARSLFAEAQTFRAMLRQLTPAFDWDEYLGRLGRPSSAR